MRKLLLMIKLLYEKIFIVILFVKYFLPELIEDVLNKTLLLNGHEPYLVRPRFTTYLFCTISFCPSSRQNT